MTVSQRRVGEVVILDLRGKLTFANDLEVHGAAEDAIDGGAHKLLLNLRAVTTIDSSGVGDLVRAHTTALNRGVTVKLCALPRAVADILEMTQLLTVFEVYGNEDEALRAFT